LRVEGLVRLLGWAITLEKRGGQREALAAGEEDAEAVDLWLKQQDHRQWSGWASKERGEREREALAAYEEVV
jgi:hypothetical protein